MVKVLFFPIIASDILLDSQVNKLQSLKIWNNENTLGLTNHLIFMRITRTPLQSLTEKNLFTHTQKRRRSIEVTLAFFIFSSTNYNVAKKKKKKKKKKRIQHFYGINISSRNVDNVHAKDTYVNIE